MSSCLCYVFQLKVKFIPERQGQAIRTSGGNILRRRRRHRDRNHPSNIPENAYHEELPYPMQVTSPRGSPDYKGTSTPTPVQVQNSRNFTRSDSAYVSLDRDQSRFIPHPPLESSRSSNISGSLAISIGQEVTNRIASFEQRYHELSCLYEQAQNDVHDMKELNAVYEEKIAKLEKENTYLQGMAEENESLKLSLEQANKENMKLQGFFHEQFNLRNKFEEMVIELEASNQRDVKNLRDQIKAKEDELRNKDDALIKAKYTISEYERKKMQQNDKNYNENLEMITRIERLQREVRKITEERDHYKEESKKEKAEIENQKKKLATVTKELDHQMQRYSYLRKDFDEKQKQLENLKRRRGSFGNVSTCSSAHSGLETNGLDPLKISRLSATSNQRFNSSLPAYVPDIKETTSSSATAVKVIKPRPKTCALTEMNKRQPSYNTEKNNSDSLPAVANNSAGSKKK